MSIVEVADGSIRSKSDPMRSIALRAKPAWRYFILTLARMLKEQYGSAVHIYCMTPQIAKFYEDFDQDEVFASINVTGLAVDALYEEVRDEALEFEKARAYEARIGWTYNSVAVGNRLYGAGYFLGGPGFMTNRHGHQSSYPQMVRSINISLDYWSQEIKEKEISLFLMGSKEMAVAAKMHNLPFRFLTSSRYKNYFFWSPNEYYENPKLESAFNAVDHLEGHDMDAPMVANMQSRDRFLQERANFRNLIWDVGYITLQQIYWRLRGYEKAKTHSLMERLRVRIQRWIDWHKVLQKSVRLATLVDKPFVFYPLHIEPEVALQRVSPEYFYQHALIAAVSRDLPAGYLLAIKEPLNGIGMRPRGFYDQVLALKNVVMIDPRDLGIDTVRQARVTITIAGSAGVEAAAMGKPVITFGKHNNYNLLDHVSIVRDELQLKDYLRDALFGEFNYEKARADGLKFLQAIVDSSIDMEGYTATKMENFDDELVNKVIGALESDLASDGKTVARAASSGGDY
jgi:hypothetical protein